MFSVDDRERLQCRILAMAEGDGRVVSAARIGSLAMDEGDRWSDLDLTFAVDDSVPIAAVLDDWTASVVAELKAVKLFDLPSGPSIYRVFLLPGCLQLDLSFTPAAEFRARGPRFALLFGRAQEPVFPQPISAEDLFGYAVHHAVRTRVCLERERYWQAEYWLSSCRDYALHLACRNRGLPAHHGRGFDDLPDELRQRFAVSLVAALEPDRLLPALGIVVAGLLDEARDLAIAGPIEADLLALASRSPSS